MKVKPLVIWMTFTATAGTAMATTPDMLMACQELQDDQQRLACYDALAQRHKQAINRTASNQKQPEALEGDQGMKDRATSNQPPSHNTPHFPVLLADLNEPNFMASVGRLDFLGDSFNAALVGAGKRHLIKAFEWPSGKKFHLNLIGQIRSQFDVDELDTRNNRGGALINTDFAVGGELVHALDHWNWRLSYTHRSTHLGDEFLIDNPEFIEQRLNLSYEIIKWDAARTWGAWDAYAGVGFISRSEPGNLDQVQWQAGLQYEGDFWHGMKPLLAFDLNSWGAYDWTINLNLRAGLEISQFTETPFLLMFEYFDGHSPYGQFFTEDLTYTGLTLLKNW